VRLLSLAWLLILLAGLWVSNQPHLLPQLTHTEALDIDDVLQMVSHAMRGRFEMWYLLVRFKHWGLYQLVGSVVVLPPLLFVPSLWPRRPSWAVPLSRSYCWWGLAIWACLTGALAWRYLLPLLR
jgi:hypothetical protein